MATVTDDLVVKIQADISDLKRGVSQSNSELQRFSSKAEKNIDRVSSSFSELVGVVALTVGAMRSLGGIINTVTTFERLDAQLKTVTGSTRAAGEAMDRLTQFASETPFQLTEVIDAFVKMKALGLDPSEEALRSFGNTATAMGKSLNQFIEAVADAVTFEFERLKEFGIRAKQEGDKVQFTFQGVTTEVDKTADSVQAFLQTIGDAQFGTAMAEQADTLNVALSNLNNAFQFMVNTLAQESGLVQLIKGLSLAMTDLATNVANQTFAEGTLAAALFNPTEGEKAAAAIQKMADQTERLKQQTVELQGILEGGVFTTPETPIRSGGESVFPGGAAALGEAAGLTTEEALVALQDAYQVKAEIVGQSEEDITKIVQEQAEKRREAEQRADMSIFRMKVGIANQTAQLIQAVAGKSKAAALATLAIQKGVAIAETIINTQVASMRALAELGPIAGAPVAASIETLGAVKVGLIAATGIAQAAGIASGGSGGVASAAGAATSASNSASAAAGGAEPATRRDVNIVIQGQQDLFSRSTVRTLIEELNEALGDGATLNIRTDTGERL